MPQGNRFQVLVESPRGSRLKLKYEPERRGLTLSRPLPLGLAYPFDFGFIEETRAADGDPLDALVFWDVPAVAGLWVECRALGVIELSQRSRGRRQRNDRLVTVPVKAERQADLRTFHDLPTRVRAEMERFFISTTFFTEKDAKILGWRGVTQALELIRRAREHA